MISPEKLGAACFQENLELLGDLKNNFEKGNLYIGLRAIFGFGTRHFNSLKGVSDCIKHIIEHPAGGELGPEQSHNLKMLFECFENATKSSVSTEVLASLLVPPK